MYSNAPDPFGDGGGVPLMVSTGLMAGSAACCTPYIRCCPFFPVQSQSTELPATTERESSRGGSPQGCKVGSLPVLFLFLNLVRVLVSF